jgi:hypothetical protein
MATQSLEEGTAAAFENAGAPGVGDRKYNITKAARVLSNGTPAQDKSRLLWLNYASPERWETPIARWISS